MLILFSTYIYISSNECSRYDYENCESAPAEKMMAELDTLVADTSFIGKTFTHDDKTFKVAKADNYGYTDPIDGSVSKKQVNIWYF